MGEFNFKKAMRSLGIKKRPFLHGDPHAEECRGYSLDNWFSINPRERYPEFVSFHEWTHFLLGHGSMHHNVNSFEDFVAYMDLKETYHDLFEAECHATAIFAAVLTGVPFDLDAELEHLQGYTMGRKIPAEIKARALKNAIKIAKAGGMRDDDIMARQSRGLRGQVAA